MESVKRTKCIKMRVTSLEYEMIRNYAKKSGMQIAPFCREKALGQKVAQIKSEEEIEAYASLAKFYNNFQSIKSLWKNKDSAVIEKINKTCQEISLHLKRLRGDW